MRHNIEAEIPPSRSIAPGGKDACKGKGMSHGDEPNPGEGQ